MLLGRYLYPFLLNDQKKREREQQSLKPFFPWCLDNVYPPRSSSLLVFPTYQGKSSKTVSVPFSLHNYDGTQLHSTTERCSALEKKVEDMICLTTFSFLPFLFLENLCLRTVLLTLVGN